jgi:hypothetical protein
MSGVTAQFTRWPGAERPFQRGFRVELVWGREDEERLPAWPEVPLSRDQLIVHTWSSWSVAVGIPFRVGPTRWPIAPFLDADPGVLLYRSSDETRYTRRTGNLYLVDESTWLIGPTLGIGTGVQIPGRGGGPRLQVRGGYRFGWFFGNEGIGTSPDGVMQLWTATAGVSAPF